ncbi:hypothetical protein HJ190_22290 [Vibrio parahaemolyticus]|nr:hypothetical protein [Vibrio parahaemolyticus]
MGKFLAVVALLAPSTVSAATPKNYLVQLLNADNEVVYQKPGGSAIGLQVHKLLDDIGFIVKECTSTNGSTRVSAKSISYSSGYLSAINLSTGEVEIEINAIDLSDYTEPEKSNKCQNTGSPKQLKETYAVKYDTEQSTLQRFKLSSNYTLQVQTQNAR